MLFSCSSSAALGWFLVLEVYIGPPPHITLSKTLPVFDGWERGDVVL